MSYREMVSDAELSSALDLDHFRRLAAFVQLHSDSYDVLHAASNHEADTLAGYIFDITESVSERERVYEFAREILRLGREAGETIDQRFYVKSRERAEYILTMRDPRKHADPLPGWFKRPSSKEYEQAAGGVDGRKEFDELYERGARMRREGNQFGDAGCHPLEPVYAGWSDQNDIAVDFYDAHVVGFSD